jgi:electron transport complex protein RnfD
MRDEKYLKVSLQDGPHVWRGFSVSCVMQDVLLALLPIVLFFIYSYGVSALGLVCSCILGAACTEWCICTIFRKKITLKDYSAVVTGLLLALTLPASFPFCLGFVGAALAILLGKMIWGGLGVNQFNPALIGRVFLQISFPTFISSWVEPFEKKRFFQFFSESLALPFVNVVPTEVENTVVHNTVAGASVVVNIGKSALEKVENRNVVAEVASLSDLEIMGKLDHVADFCGGCFSVGMAGVSVLLILTGALFLIYRNVIDWRIPLSIFVTVAVLTFFIGREVPSSSSALFVLFSGSLVFGAFFMATDMVTSPLTVKGRIYYGAVIGLAIVFIRLFFEGSDSVVYGILIGNAGAPLLDKCTQDRVYGVGRY